MMAFVAGDCPRNAGQRAPIFWWGALDGEEEGGTLTRRRSFEFLFAVLVRADRF